MRVVVAGKNKIPSAGARQLSDIVSSGQTYAALARKIGCSPASIPKWLTGDVVPDSYFRTKLRVHFQIDPAAWDYTAEVPKALDALVQKLSPPAPAREFEGQKHWQPVQSFEAERTAVQQYLPHVQDQPPVMPPIAPPTKPAKPRLPDDYIPGKDDPGSIAAHPAIDTSIDYSKAGSAVTGLLQQRDRLARLVAYAGSQGDPAYVLRVEEAYARCLERLARLQGELSRIDERRLASSATYIRMVNRVTEVLRRHPEVCEQVLQVLERPEIDGTAC